jgi:hypothetical protein
MIVTKEVKIKMEGKNFKIFKDRGYIFNWRETINIKVEDLLPSSNVKVLVMCDLCDKKSEIIYKSYTRNINRSGYYSCQSCSTMKRITTCIDKYGIDNPIKLDIFKDKIKNTNLEKYGTEYTFQSEIVKDKILKTMIDRYGCNHYIKSDDYKIKSENIINKSKQTKISKGIQLSDEVLNNFKIYKRNCRNITNRNKKELLKYWNGFDYYDNEYIKENYKLNSNDKCYPTIDHKVSVWYGFTNNISVEEIGSIDNLCITKRSINSLKNKKTENEYK